MSSSTLLQVTLVGQGFDPEGLRMPIPVQWRLTLTTVDTVSGERDERHYLSSTWAEVEVRVRRALEALDLPADPRLVIEQFALDRARSGA